MCWIHQKEIFHLIPFTTPNMNHPSIAENVGEKGNGRKLV
jgi:hypothetical protein